MEVCTVSKKDIKVLREKNIIIKRKTLDRMRKLSSTGAGARGDAVVLFESCPVLEDFDVERFALDTLEYLESPAYCPVCGASYSSGLVGRECPCCVCGIVAGGKRRLCEVVGMDAGGEES